MGWILLCLFSWVGALPVSAHANLLHTTPSENEVVGQSPAEITLQFSEPLDLNLVELQLYDRLGHALPLSRPQLKPGDPSQLDVKPPSLPAGTYTVVWNVVSEDGHPVSGSFSFTVGKETPGAPSPVSTANHTVANISLVLLCFWVEGLVLLTAGIVGFSRMAKRGGFPGISQQTRLLRLAPVLLLVGLIGEWLAYSFQLPGEAPIQDLIHGEWNPLWQSPFTRMILVQLPLTVLLLLPSMEEIWYVFGWLALTCTLATGGHAWGVQPVWLALAVRVLHLLAISLWLGGLTYFFLVWQGKGLSDGTIDLSRFRPFFVRVALLASVLVAGSGTLMAFLQTDWASLTQNTGTWSLLLLAKVALFLLMGLFALRQTLAWRQSGRPVYPRLLAGEWVTGILLVGAGVWMSQSAYPQPSHLYAHLLQADGREAYVEISALRVGKQRMTLQLHEPDGKEAHSVQVELDMLEHQIQLDPIPAKNIAPHTYQADLSFSMPGTWIITVDVLDPEGTHVRWSDKLYIRDGGESQ
jgi:copper transport protein